MYLFAGLRPPILNTTPGLYRRPRRLLPVDPASPATAPTPEHDLQP